MEQTSTVQISYTMYDETHHHLDVEVPYQPHGGGLPAVPKWVTSEWAERKVTEHTGGIRPAYVDLEVTG